MIGVKNILENIFDLKNRKSITLEIKKSRNVAPLVNLVKHATPKQLLYLGEPLAECFKLSKLHISQSDSVCIIEALLVNCERTVKSAAVELPCHEEVKLFGESCQGLNLGLKSQYWDAFCTASSENECVERLSNLARDTQEVLAKIGSDKHISRDTLVLVIPLVVTIQETHCGFTIADHIATLDNLPNGFLKANWLCCHVKQLKFNETHTQRVSEIIQLSLREITSSYLWYKFVYLEIVFTILNKHAELIKQMQYKDHIRDIFNVVSLYSDDRGLNVDKVCSDIQILCLKLCPVLIVEVRRLSNGPWYSRNTLLYKTLLYSIVTEMDRSELVSDFSDLLSHLGYNLLDGCAVKTIKVLLDRHLDTDNVINLLDCCVGNLKEKSEICWVLCVYVAPLLKRKPTPVLINHVVDLLDSGKLTQHQQIFLFETSYTVASDIMHDILLNSQVNTRSRQ